MVAYAITERYFNNWEYEFTLGKTYVFLTRDQAFWYGAAFLNNPTDVFEVELNLHLPDERGGTDDC